MPWTPGVADPPQQVRPGPWHYFTADEGATIEAMVDRLIPADADTPGGKDVGCAVYIDRQLAGPYGRRGGYYMAGPFKHGTKQQGVQSATTPAALYRKGLAALDAHCRKVFGGKRFVDLADADKDDLLAGIEHDKVKLEGADGHTFFEQLIKDTQQGFFADPIYGANKDMAAWRMIGFPGARYDYRDWVERHNEHFPLPPVSISQHPSWSQ
ncbi:MAG TPA: gluconate 2-dehydrogenase subunit 3 family protein [Pseudolabrys sp.]|nr:gluconate 2-dehydrogenase subunit 3 family protein [Pseudolabrys sp.]